MVSWVGALGLLAGLLGVVPSASAATVSGFVRVSGPDRYATAVAVAQAAFPSGAPAAVVATGTSFPDALAADYLAGQVGGPVLLTDPTVLPAVTSAELTALGVSTVYVVGGTGAVSAAVAASVAALHTTGGAAVKVVRVSGSDRYGTAAAVATQIPAVQVGQVGGTRTALLATGTGFADALAGSAAAAGGHLPLLLTDPTVLSPVVLSTLKTLGITQVVILGGTGAVSAGVASALTAAGISVTRLGGADRVGTATLVASWELSALGFTATSVSVARGDNPGGGVDALALGVLAGLGHQPLLLAASPTSLGSALAAWLAADTGLAGGTVAGGTGAISPAVLTLLADYLGTASGGGGGGGGGATTLAVSTSSLPAGTVGTAYSATLKATGGTSPYTWAITTGTLPPGLSLNITTGAITGTPTTAGTANLTVQVTDATTPAAGSATASLMLTVGHGVLWGAPTYFPTGLSAVSCAS